MMLAPATWKPYEVHANAREARWHWSIVRNSPRSIIASAILLIFQERVTGFLNETLNEYM